MLNRVAVVAVVIVAASCSAGAASTAPAAKSATTRRAAPPTMMVFGDSTAVLVGMGVAGNDGQLTLAPGGSQLGCPISRVDEIRFDGATYDVDHCHWDETWIPALRDVGGVDIALISAGFWDATEVRSGVLGRRWTSLDDDAFVEHLIGEMVEVTDALVAAGAGHVVWTTVGSNTVSGTVAFERHRLVLNELIWSLTEERPGIVSVIDVAGYLDAPENLALRPDGIHLTTPASEQLWRDWLTDEVLTVVAEDRVVATRASREASSRQPSPTVPTGPGDRERR